MGNKPKMFWSIVHPKSPTVRLQVLYMIPPTWSMLDF